MPQGPHAAVLVSFGSMGYCSAMQVKRNAGNGPINRLSPRLDSDVRAWLPKLSALWKNGEADTLSPGDIDELGTSLLALQRGLTGDRRLAGAGYMDDPQLLGAYLLYYWPVSYLEGRFALSTLNRELSILSASAREAGRPLRVLDCGSGPAPLAAALADSLESAGGSSAERCPSCEIVLLDSSPAALKLGQSLLGKAGSPPLVTTRTLNLESGGNLGTELNSGPGGPEAAVAEQPFDLILLGHTLNELWRGDARSIERRSAFAAELASKLGQNGLLIVLEPALLETSRALLAVRDRLVAAGIRAVAPCLCPSSPCPALAAGPMHTCHLELGWMPPEPVASLARRAGLDRESVKVCFMAFSAPAATFRGTELGDFGAEPGLLGRVVSEPMLNKAGRIRYLLCDGRNRFAFSAKSDDPAARRGGFFDLCRGDLILIRNPEDRSLRQKGGQSDGPAYGWRVGTELKVLERPGAENRRPIGPIGTELPESHAAGR